MDGVAAIQNAPAPIAKSLDFEPAASDLRQGRPATAEEDAETDAPTSARRSSFMRIFHHRRTASTEKMISIGDSSTGTPVKPKVAASDYSAMNDIVASVRPDGIGLSTPGATTNTDPDSTAGKLHSPPTETTDASVAGAPSLTAAEAGKLAAVQRERAADPKAALDVLASSLPPAKDGKLPPTKDGKPPAPPSASWMGRWSFSSKGSPANSGRFSGSDKYDSVRDDDDATAGQAPSGGCEMSDLATLIEKNQSEQEELRRLLHVKQAELTQLLQRQQAALVRAADAAEPAP